MNQPREGHALPAQGRSRVPEAAAFFDAQVDRWVELYRRKASFVDRLALFTRAIRESVPPGGRVLDVGCGAGSIALAIAETGIVVFGVDGAPNMIAEAEKESARRKITNVQFKVADLSSATFDAEAFDAVVCSSVLEYIEDDALLLERMAKALRPGGVLLLSVPSASSISGFLEDLLANSSRFTRAAGHQHLRYSLRRYHRNRLRAVLDRVGLTWSGSALFEFPFLGRLGVALSRLPFVGVLRLIIAKKQTESTGKATVRRSPIRSRAMSHAVSRKNFWEAMPSSMRTVVGVTIGRLPSSWLLGRKFRRTLAFALEVEKWSAEQSRDFQSEQLRRICTLAYEETAFYRKAFDVVGFQPDGLRSPEDISSLPLIDKATLRDHFDDMCAVARESHGTDTVSTGGSSGEPLRFRIGADRSAIEYAYLVASWARVGYRLAIPQAVFRGQVVSEDRKGLRHSFDPILRRHCYSSFHMGGESMRKYVTHIASLGPIFLHAYPSSLAALVRFLQRSGMAAPTNVLGMLVESETVHPGDRSKAEETFGVRCFSSYGHSEKLVLAAECEHSTDYHVWPTYGFVELLDSDGNPVTTPGHRGEIVGTGFINRVMPFIRYRTGDYAEYVGDHCAKCGRAQMILRDVRGHRTQEHVVAADGTEISWTALNMHDNTFDGVVQFQFFQDTPGKATLRIVPGVGYSEQDGKRILRNLNRKLEGRIQVDIALTNSIPLTPNGKAIYVDQHIPTAVSRVASG